MNTLTRTLVGSLAVLTAGTALTITPAPAQAAPGFSESYLEVSTSAWLATGTCNNDGSTTTPSADIPITENGPALTNTLTATARYVAAGDPSDTIANTSVLTTSTAFTSTNGLPRSISMTFSGTTTVTASKATSACEVETRTAAYGYYDFTLTQPMWATLTKSSKGAAYAETYLSVEDGYPYDDHYGRGLDLESASTSYLAPGHYGGFLEAELKKRAKSGYAATGSGRLTITFAPVGSATKAPIGKARKYVALPGSRACATHDATSTLTTRKKLVKQIAKVTFTVNGKKAATLKGKKLKKGKAVVLALADSTAAEITATVTLDNGDKRTVDASYLACSG